MSMRIRRENIVGIIFVHIENIPSELDLEQARRIGQVDRCTGYVSVEIRVSRH